MTLLHTMTPPRSPETPAPGVRSGSIASPLATGPVFRTGPLDPAWEIAEDETVPTQVERLARAQATALARVSDALHQLLRLRDEMHRSLEASERRLGGIVRLSEHAETWTQRAEARLVPLEEQMTAHREQLDAMQAALDTAEGARRTLARMQRAELEAAIRAERARSDAQLDERTHAVQARLVATEEAHTDALSALEKRVGERLAETQRVERTRVDGALLHAELRLVQRTHRLWFVLLGVTLLTFLGLVR
jgi:chromosome segregation ATPase